MKKIMLLLSLITLSGCNTISNVNANDYLTANAQKPDNSLLGVWVAGMGPYLSTIKLNQDGSGLFCYSWNGKNVLYKLVYNGKSIIVQSGEKLDIDNFSQTEINVTANYYMSQKYTFYRDDNLKKLSAYCAENIK